MSRGSSLILDLLITDRQMSECLLNGLLFVHLNISMVSINQVCYFFFHPTTGMFNFTQ